MTPKLLALPAVLLATACASPLPTVPNTCSVKVEWEITEYVNAACRAAGAKVDARGCHVIKRDGTHRIITGPVKSRRDLETVGHELTHACFGRFHGADLVSDALFQD